VRTRRPLALLAASVALAGCDRPDVIPDAVTRQGERMQGLWWFSNWAGLAVALLVWTLVAIAVVRFRRRGDDDSLPRQNAYNIPVEILYTVAPLVVVGVLFGLTVAVQEDITDVDPDPDLVVNVTGFQWQWAFEYEGHDVVVVGTEDGAPELVLPVGSTVRFELRTADVVHSFWVPRFLEKRDAVQGVDNQVDVEIEEPGHWEGRCAEFCGLRHERMNFSVRAVPPDDFDAWLESR
jgi:cytochrome c oxidase subunit II